MNFTIHIASTEAEREQIYRLRYEIYVEELHIFGEVADHQNRMLYGPGDEHARLMYAKAGDEVVGTMRLNLGKDAPFSDELETTYNLKRFRTQAADDQLMVLTRFVVKKAYRGSNLSFLMVEKAAEISVEECIEIACCDCQPHLIRFYQRIGFRSYECDVYNDPAFGIMIPLAFVIRDLGYLDDMRSPLRKALDQPVHDLDRVKAMAATLGNAGVEAISRLEESSYESLFASLAKDRKSVFYNLEAADIQTIVSQGHVIELREGDQVIRKGQATATVFVVLEGELEVQPEEEPAFWATQGDAVGVLSFILGIQRTANVFVSSKKALVFSINENRLNQRLNRPSKATTRLLQNLCKSLAVRITASRERVSRSSVFTQLMAA